MLSAELHVLCMFVYEMNTWNVGSPMGCRVLSYVVWLSVKHVFQTHHGHGLDLGTNEPCGLLV